MSALGDAIRAARFSPVRLRDGYDMREVDDFLDRLSDAADLGQPLTPLMAEARFSVVRLREAYDIGAVDDFLEGIGRPADAAAPADRPPDRSTPRVVEPELPRPSVIEERRGPFSRLFGRR